ncbi:DEAD/DEAH box helicase family protein [bacterium]|nr:DEAD/DEAH box helicase family protein [bacterium]
MPSKIFPFQTYIAFDTETTGLNPEDEAIIEIGAVKFVNGEPRESFEMIVNTDKPIPLFIQKLTGISQQEVNDAPPLETAIREFLNFIGDNPLVAHNARFDYDFINAKLIMLGYSQLNNRIFDTLILSRVFLPRLINHKLETVASFWGIKLESLHRARDDAQLAGMIFQMLWKYGLSTPSSIIESILYMSLNLNNPQFGEFIQMIREHPLCGKCQPPEQETSLCLDYYNQIGSTGEARVEFDSKNIITQLKDGSPLAGIQPQFKERMIQLQMVSEVCRAFQQEEFLLIEAGTGTGKSFAYLIPALYLAAAQNTKVVISTNTKNLQEQLFYKDIPVVYEALPFDFKAVLLKGMSNYLCIRRYDQYLKNPIRLNYWEREGMLYLAVWVTETRSGDIVENTSFSTRTFASLWEKVRGDGYKCMGGKCPFNRKCFIHNIRREQKKAHLVVINHSLLFSDLESENNILGEYGYAVLDEAHNLDKVAIEYMGAVFSLWEIRNLLSQLYSTTPILEGVLPSLLGNFKLKHPNKPEAKQNGIYQNTVNCIKSLKTNAESFFNTLADKYDMDYKWRSQKYSLKTRYTEDMPLFIDYLLPEGERLNSALEEVIDSLRSFLRYFGSGEDTPFQDEIKEGEAVLLRLEGLSSLLDYLLKPAAQNAVFWLEAPTRPDSIEVKLCWAPLDVGELIYHKFLENMNSVIFTSATLTVARNFNYIRERLGLNLGFPERVREVTLGDQFDYRRQLRVALPQYISLPDSGKYMEQAPALISKLARRRGGMLVLSTSYAMLNHLYLKIREGLEERGILVLAQGISGSRSTITRQFKEGLNAVLLGTESFWEGVDIPGEALQVLVLLKLPFAVPTDPYVEAYCNWLLEKGQNPFNTFMVPEAVIKFRQGIGRLIRSESDRGVLLILDQRLSLKTYGRLFLNSLPTSADLVWSDEELLDFIDGHLA